MNSGHGISTREREDTEQIQDPTQSDLINSSHDTMRVARHNNAISADAMALDVSNMLDNITTRLRRDVMEAVCAVRTASTKYMDTLMEDERQIASNRISALQEEVVQLQAKLEQMEISQALSRQQFEKAIQRCGSQRQCAARRDFHRLILSSWRDYARKRCSLRHRLQFYRTYHQQAVSRRVIQEWRLITQSRKIRRLESHQALLVEEHARQLHAYLLDRVAKSENEIASLKRQLIQEQEKTHELQNRCTGDVLRSVAMLHHEAIALFRPKTVEGGRKIGPEEECMNEDPKRDLRAHRVACGGSSNTSHQVFAEQSIMEDDRTALNATRAHTEDAESSVTSHYPGVGKVGRNFGGKHSKLWTDETIHGLSRVMWRAPLTPTPSVGGRVAWSVVEENEQLSPEQAIDSVTHPYSFTQSASGNSGTTLALHPKQTDSFQETSHARIQNGHHDPTQVQPVQSKSTRGREEGMCRSSNQSSTKDTANKTRSALHGRSSSQSLTSRNMKSCVPRVTLNPNHPLIKMRQNHLRSTLQ